MGEGQSDRASPSTGPNTPDVSVVIVCYRTPTDVMRCLQSVLEATAAEVVVVEVIVVDNGSGDETGASARDRFPTVRLIGLADNIGFARAVNLAATHAAGSYLLLLNPDTVMRKGAISALLACAQRHPNAGIVGGKTLTVDGDTEPSSCLGLPTTWSTLCFATGLSTILRNSATFNPEALPGWNRDDAREVGVVTGCLLLVSMEVWSRLGGFDPRFFMYGEDVDLNISVAEHDSCLTRGAAWPTLRSMNRPLRLATGPYTQCRMARRQTR